MQHAAACSRAINILPTATDTAYLPAFLLTQTFIFEQSVYVLRPVLMTTSPLHSSTVLQERNIP